MISLTSFLIVVIFIVQDPRPTYMNSIQNGLSGKVTLPLFQFVTDTACFFWEASIAWIVLIFLECSGTTDGLA